MSFACRAFWNLYLHPDINRDPFSNDENKQLIEIVNLFQCQNWEAIARELNTNRSPYLLCVHYFSKLTNTNIPVRFTQDEDDYLLDLVESNRVGGRVQWSKVAYFMKDRTRRQVYQRYRYTLSNTEKKMGKFSESEDVFLLCLVNKYGQDFDKISEKMPHRKKSQLHLRYHEYLKHEELHYGNWTLEEDQLIMQHVQKNGPRHWGMLVLNMKRTSAHIRHRYNVMKNKLEANPGMTVAKLPRRTIAPTVVKNQVSRAIDSVGHYIKSGTLPVLDTFIPTTGVKGVGRPQRSYADEELINYFRPTAHIRKERLRKSITEESLQNSARSIQVILDLLGVRLKIPTKDDMRNYYLDEIDKEILGIMSSSEQAQVMPPTGVIGDVPPNVHTIQALRCLLMKYHEHYKSKTTNVPDLLDDDVAKHLKNFEERFTALFRWPCLMSITEPPEPVTTEEVETRYPNLMPKQPGRPPKISSKILKMNAARQIMLSNSSSVTISRITASSSSQTKTTPAVPTISLIPCPSTSKIDLPKEASTSSNTLDSPVPKVSPSPMKFPEFPITSESLVKTLTLDKVTEFIRTSPADKTTRILVKLDKGMIEKLQRQKKKIIVLKTMPAGEVIKRRSENMGELISKKPRLS